MPTQSQVDQAVNDLSNVAKLVHLAFRWDSQHQAEIETQIFKNMRTSYENELTRNAAALGCNRVGRLREGQELTDLKRMAIDHAASIVRTYNLDLSRAIAAIRQENPRANRYYYATRLEQWDANRKGWKDKQVMLMTVQFASQAAREDFLRNNPVTGKVYVQPKTAAEPECQALIDGEPYDTDIVFRTPLPLHFNCVHSYVTKYDRIPKSGCEDLWMG